MSWHYRVKNQSSQIPVLKEFIMGVEMAAKEFQCYNNDSPVNQEILIEGRLLLWKESIVHVH